MGRIKIKIRSLRNNTSRIDPIVTLIIVFFNVVKVAGGFHFCKLIDAFHVLMKVRVVSDSFFVTLKMTVIDNIKSNQRSK